MLPEIDLGWLQARVREDDEGCWIWTGCMSKAGQPQATINYQHFLVRRAVWQAAHNRVLLPTTWVGVKCGKHGCTHPDCLVARGRAEALRGHHMTVAHKATIARVKRAKSAITDEMIAEIMTSNEPDKVIAERLGVCASYPSKVRQGRLRRQYSSPFAGLGV